MDFPRFIRKRLKKRLDSFVGFVFENAMKNYEKAVKRPIPSNTYHLKINQCLRIAPKIVIIKY